MPTTSTTRSWTVKDVTISVTKSSETTAGGRLVAFLKGLEHPEQGLPPVPGRPDQGLPPSPGHPDQGLPGGAPVYPAQLPAFIADNAQEIARVILDQCFTCQSNKPQPK